MDTHDYSWILRVTELQHSSTLHLVANRASEAACLKGAGALIQAITVAVSSLESAAIPTALTKDSTVVSVGAELLDQIPHTHVNNHCTWYKWLIFFFSVFWSKLTSHPAEILWGIFFFSEKVCYLHNFFCNIFPKVSDLVFTKETHVVILFLYLFPILFFLQYKRFCLWP